MKTETGFWYCEHCEMELDSSRVTFQETHDTCQEPVKWIELKDMHDLTPKPNGSKDNRYG